MERNALTELEQLSLNGSAKSFLRETAKWSKFLSILGFIGIGLMILFGLFSTTIYSPLFDAMVQQQPMPFNMGTFMKVWFIIMALIYFFPVYYLFQFSRKLKIALRSKDDSDLSSAFESLKSHYKFIGVFAIIILSLYALVFIVAMLGVLS